MGMRVFVVGEMVRVTREDFGAADGVARVVGRDW